VRAQLQRHSPSAAALLVAALVSLPASPLEAKQRVIKLGTVAPEGTLPHLALKQMAQVFAEETGGKVQLKIYPGVVGDEPTIVRKMRIGQLQGAMLTSKGLATISPEPMAVQLPMLFADTAEIDAVFAAMQPTFDRALTEDGFVPIAWCDGGWMYLFSARPAVALDDLGGRRMWMWPHDEGAVLSFVALGLEPVVLSDIDIVPSLRTGLVEVFPATPVTAMALQTYRDTPHMIEVPLAYMLGGVVISADAWESIAPPARERILRRCAKIGEQLSADVRRDSAEAIEIMQRKGLTVHRPTSAQREEWRAAAIRARATAIGVSVDAALFERVLAERERYRARARRR